MIETERKYIIQAVPDSILQNFEGYKKIAISQTYLQSTDGLTRRVRKSVFSDGSIEYMYNQKKRVSDISCIEDEKRITKAEYALFLDQKEPHTCTVEKIRRVFVFKGQTFEVDSYAFSNELCVCETELESEEMRAEFPQEITIVREVSGDKHFSNHSIAKLLFKGENIF